MIEKKDKPAVNFAILRSLEDYVEKSGNFRTKCASFSIPGRDSGGSRTLYIPYCDKQRFDFGSFLNDCRGHAVFLPPQVGKPWSPMDYVLFREHFLDIRCPPDCRGYRNRRIATLLARLKGLGGIGLKMRGKSATKEKWTTKEKVGYVAVPILAVLLGSALALINPELRRVLHLDKPIPDQQISKPTVPPPTASGPSENHQIADKVIAVVKPSSVVDWHDKRNWRKYMHTGITRTDVRQIFGEPRKIRVNSNLETWEYGSGTITFKVDNGTPDGNLYSWAEPN